MWRAKPCHYPGGDAGSESRGILNFRDGFVIDMPVTDGAGCQTTFCNQSSMSLLGRVPELLAVCRAGEP